MKKMSKKKKVRIILIIGMSILLMITFYFGWDRWLNKADTPFLPENRIENKAYSQYQDERGEDVREESNIVSVWKVDLVELVAELQGREENSTEDVAGKLTIKNLANTEIGTIDLKLDENSKVAPDWTTISSIENPNLDYNLVLKIPGFLPKHLNNIKLNQKTSILTNTMYAGDVNVDGVINIRDFSGMMAYWQTNDPATDFTGDGSVNQFDFSLMMSNWDKTESS